MTTHEASWLARQVEDKARTGAAEGLVSALAERRAALRRLGVAVMVAESAGRHRARVRAGRADYGRPRVPAQVRDGEHHLSVEVCHPYGGCPATKVAERLAAAAPELHDAELGLLDHASIWPTREAGPEHLSLELRRAARCQSHLLVGRDLRSTRDGAALDEELRRAELAHLSFCCHRCLPPGSPWELWIEAQALERWVEEEWYVAQLDVRTPEGTEPSPDTVAFEVDVTLRSRLAFRVYQPAVRRHAAHAAILQFPEPSPVELAGLLAPIIDRRGAPSSG